ncbi:hypothetical protein AN958_01402 [Leucoagaricus sp. SymC.cos]|nr:hypothetical protein AN958_01402 [Leucoagaricus sp. SymC.cos]
MTSPRWEHGLERRKSFRYGSGVLKDHSGEKMDAAPLRSLLISEKRSPTPLLSPSTSEVERG